MRSLGGSGRGAGPRPPGSRMRSGIPSDAAPANTAGASPPRRPAPSSAEARAMPASVPRRCAHPGISRRRAARRRRASGAGRERAARDARPELALPPPSTNSVENVRRTLAPRRPRRKSESAPCRAPWAICGIADAQVRRASGRHPTSRDLFGLGRSAIGAARESGVVARKVFPQRLVDGGLIAAPRVLRPLSERIDNILVQQNRDSRLARVLQHSPSFGQVILLSDSSSLLAGGGPNRVLLGLTPPAPRPRVRRGSPATAGCGCRPPSAHGVPCWPECSA